MDLSGQRPKRRDPKTMKLTGFPSFFNFPLNVIMVEHPKPYRHGLAIASRSIQQAGPAFGDSSPCFLLKGMGPPALIGKPHVRKTIHEFTASISCNKSSFVLAAWGALSFLHLKIRGKRKATPDLCLGLALIPSKAISKTCSGLTLLTGPNFSKVFLLIQLSNWVISLSVSPE